MKKFLFLIFSFGLLAGTGWLLYSNGHVPFTEPKLKKAIVWEICNSRTMWNHLVLSNLEGCPEVEPQILDVRKGKDGRRCVNAKVEVAENRMIPVRIVVRTDTAFSFANVSILGTNREGLFLNEADAQVKDLQSRILDPKELCKNPTLSNNLVEAQFFLSETPTEIKRTELEWNYYCSDLSKEEAARIAAALPKRQARPRRLTGMPQSLRPCEKTPAQPVGRRPTQ
jgi:hypothetical protein